MSGNKVTKKDQKDAVRETFEHLSDNMQTYLSEYTDKFIKKARANSDEFIGVEEGELSDAAKEEALASLDFENAENITPDDFYGKFLQFIKGTTAPFTYGAKKVREIINSTDAINGPTLYVLAGVAVEADQIFTSYGVQANLPPGFILGAILIASGFNHTAENVYYDSIENIIYERIDDEEENRDKKIHEAKQYIKDYIESEL